MAIIDNTYFDFAARLIHHNSIYFTIPIFFSLKFTKIMDRSTFYHPTKDHYLCKDYFGCFILYLIINFDFTHGYNAPAKFDYFIQYFY